MTSPPWYLYLLECVDGSVYTGIAVDVERRYAEHRAGTGARYTRARPPVRLLGVRTYPDRSSASRAEAAVKRLSPTAKRALARDATIPVVFIEPRARRKKRAAPRSNPPGLAPGPSPSRPTRAPSSRSRTRAPSEPNTGPKVARRGNPVVE